MEFINMNTLTCIALGYWAIAALWAGFRGMIRTFLSFLVIILSVVITYTASPAVYQSLHNSAYVKNYLQNQSGTLVDNFADGIESGSDDAGWLDVLPLPEEVKSAAALGDKGLVAQLIRTDYVKNVLSFQLTNIMTRIISIFLTGIGSFILLTVLRVILLRIADLPGISAADHLLGFLFGVIKGIVIIWIALLVIRIAALTGHGAGLMQQVRGSEILTVIDEYNLVRSLIVALITRS